MDQPDRSSLEQIVTTNVRAELAAQRKTAVDLAEGISIGYTAATRRINGTQPFSLGELGRVARWLEVPVSSLMTPRKSMTAVA